jgi:gamma-glutamyltranspeptidase/glutathione hydrolase/leukotriene-C4 hydrolase
MFSSGIGGGGFLVIRPASHTNDTTPLSIDFRETSPTGSHANMYVGLSASASKIGGLAVGVPGELRGFEAAYNANGGGVSWERIFAPAVELAEKGWNVTDELDRRLKLFGQFILEDKEWKKIFAVKDSKSPTGYRLKTKGEWISRPAYGRTLRALAAGGADVFYNVSFPLVVHIARHKLNLHMVFQQGPIADSSIATIKAAGGKMTRADLATYKAVVQPALKGTYHNRTIYTTHAPSAGPILIHLLNVLERYNLQDGERDGLNTHRFVEALKCEFLSTTKALFIMLEEVDNVANSRFR